MSNLNPGGGETADAVSAWTVDSSLAHLSQIINERDRRYEERFVAQEKAVEDALAAAKEAVNKAETASEKRFDAVNEFRAQLGDQAATFLPRPEYDAQHKALEDKVEAAGAAFNSKLGAVEKGCMEAIGRNSELIAALALRMERGDGQRTGIKDGWAWLVGAVGFAATIISIVVVLSR